MPFYVFEREYNLRTHIIKIEINYFSYDLNPFGDDPELNLDLIDAADFEQGYDDQDLLVFYPNKMKFVFDDLFKRNFNILKYSISQPEFSFYINKSKYAGVKFYADNEFIFDGYIDMDTLSYSEEEREITFEAIDKSKFLKDLPVQRLTNQGFSYSLGYLIYVIYKQVFLTLQPRFYNHPNFSNGLYIKHDWIFTGKRTLTDIIRRDWSIASDFQQTFFNWDSVGVYGEQRYTKTYADLLKLMALQFGMVIGNLSPTKIYMVKRYGLLNPETENIDDKLSIKFQRGMHLNSLRGIRNKNTWNGERYYSAGSVETMNGQISGELKFPDAVKDFETFIGSYQEINNSGTAIYTADGYPVFDGVQDLNISSSNKHIAQIICDWEYGLRKTPKERFVDTLDGTDYTLAKFYRITRQDIISEPITYRPILIKKNYVRNETTMTGVEYARN